MRVSTINDILDAGAEYLSQYGVLGMKWGRRKDRGSRQSRSANDSDDYKASRATKKKKTRTLTNAEIQKANNRFQLERQYAQLKRDQTAIARGNAAVKGVLAITATAGSVYGFLQSPLGKVAIAKGQDYIDKIRAGTYFS